MLTQGRGKKSESPTKQQKGAQFEEQVARWLKRRFRDLKLEVKVNQYANGLTVKRPYQIDVHMWAKGKGLFVKEADVWVECKWKEKSSVKRTDVMKLVFCAQDVYRAHQSGKNEIYYNGLMLVSNQSFDYDALAYAEQEDVLCVRFDGQKYEPQNEYNNWVGKPQWLKRVS
jgi:hypothetical protein